MYIYIYISYMSLELLQPAALCTESEAEVAVTLMVKKVFQPERSCIALSLLRLCHNRKLVRGGAVTDASSHDCRPSAPQ